VVEQPSPGSNTGIVARCPTAGNGSAELGWWARQGSNQFLAQKATLPICQRPSCNRSSFCAIPLKSFIFVARITF
jgi:hypothetical protein